MLQVCQHPRTYSGNKVAMVKLHLRFQFRFLQTYIGSNVIPTHNPSGRPRRGPIAGRVTIEVEVVGSNLQQNLLTNRQADSARAWIGEIRCKSTSIKSCKLGCRTLSMRDENEGKYWGGGREATCDHGMSRRSLRVKPLTS